MFIACLSCICVILLNKFNSIQSAKRRLVRNYPSIFTPLFSLIFSGNNLIFHSGTLPCYLVPSNRVLLLVITMTIFLHAFRSLAEPHSSVSVQFVTALMSSSQHARGLPLFLVPQPIPNIIDIFKLYYLRMICPKYESCRFLINASSGFVD